MNTYSALNTLTVIVVVSWATGCLIIYHSLESGHLPRSVFSVGVDRVLSISKVAFMREARWLSKDKEQIKEHSIGMCILVYDHFTKITK